MSVIILLLLSTTVGVVVALVAARPVPVSRARRHAFVALSTGVVVVAGLAYLVHSHSAVVRLDHRVARWAHAHATGRAHRVIDALTHLGAMPTLIVLAAVLVAVEWRRARIRWVGPYLVAVIAGEWLLTDAVKHLTDRARPALNSTAATLGPSFPSGHSAGAAAFYAAAALLVARGRGPRARALLAGGAAAVAVAVACSRVLLVVHWTSDAVAGLALGWAWFAVCSAVFGVRLTSRRRL